MSDQNMNRRNLALIAGILAIGLVAATIVGGQSMTAAAQQQDQNGNSQQPTVSTNGAASADVKPDKVNVTVGVETEGETAAEAAAANAELMEKVLAALKALGITDEQIATSSYNVFPVYESRAAEVCIQIYPPPPECLPKSEIVGYKASNSVTVTVDASFDAGSIIDTAVEAGASSVSGVYFFVSQERQEEIRDDLIGEAISNARSRADKAAEAVDMEVIGVKSINLNDVYFPVFYREVAVDASGSTPIHPGEQQVVMNVQVIYTMG